jgi:hypothetical protein
MGKRPNFSHHHPGAGVSKRFRKNTHKHRRRSGDIIFEVANAVEAPEQYAMTNYIKNYKALRSKQHLI